METYFKINDIKHPVTLYIEDVKSLTAFCNTNQESRKMCSTYDFWKSQFEQYHLPITSMPNNVDDWIKLYAKTHQIMIDTDHIIKDQLTLKTIHDNISLNQFADIDVPPANQPINYVNIVKYGKSILIGFSYQWPHMITSTIVSEDKARKVLYQWLFNNIVQLQ